MKNILAKNLNKDGYLLVKNFLANNKKFIKYSNEINFLIKKELKKVNIKNYGGSLIGNINVYPGYYGKKIFKLLEIAGLKKIIKNCTGMNLKNFDILYGGNLNLPKKHNQHFHTDGNYNDQMLIVSIATSDVKTVSGPTEIVLKSHKKKYSYLNFLLSKKKIKKLLLSKGDLLIRKHNLWHRGTINYSNKLRFQIAFMLFDKRRMFKKKVFKNRLYFVNNFFGNNLIGKFKEYIYVYLKPIYIIYKLFRSNDY